MEYFKPFTVIWLLTIFSGFAHASLLIIDRPDPWFTPEVSIDPSTIPAEISFNSESQTLINETGVPLYIVRAINEPLDWIGVLPNNVIPIFKIVTNTSFSFSYERGELSRRSSRRIEGQVIGSVDIFRAISSHERDTLLGTKGPGRPTDVKPPEPEAIVITGYYGAKKVNIEGKIYFKFNESYEKTGFGNWFAFDKLDIDEEQLPPGVEIKQIPKSHNLDQRFMYEIFNSSDTPFYIVKEFDSPIDWVGNLPNDVLPDYKLVSGNSYSSRNIQHPKLKDAWQLNQNYPMLEITPHLITQLVKPAFKLIDKRGDCRPEKVDIPEPLPFEIVMFYGAKKQTVKGNIIYKLNENYNPHAGNSDISTCDENGQSVAGTDKQKPMSSGRECNTNLAGNGNRAKAVCYDLVKEGWRGPLMVVVPAGGGFQLPFAISKYEISVADYSKYCALTEKCITVTDKNLFDEPQTSISLQDAEEFAKWLSERTGKKYRLPTSAEWTYAANANGEQPRKDFNCRVVLADRVIKGAGRVSVTSGSQNGWGLKNYIGNVQEWVVEGDKVSVQGGAYTDPFNDCDISLSRPHTGEADDITGFRVLLEDVL